MGRRRVHGLRDDHAIGEVADHYFRCGRGISSSELRSLFEDTYRAKRAEKEHGTEATGAAAWSLASRRHKDPGDAESAARGLAIALRRREHAERALRGHCAGAAPTLEPSREWRERAFETVRSLQPEIQTCRERAAEDERPLRMHVLVHLEPSGRVSLAVPVDVAFEHARWGATDAAHCIVKRLESVTFPPPNANVALLLPFVHPSPR